MQASPARLVPLATLFSGLVGCAGAEADDSAVQSGEISIGEAVQCSDPSLRETNRFDRIELPDEWVASDPQGDAGQYDGGGAAVADFDGDGWLDLFLPNTGKDQLFLGQADGTLHNADDRLPDNATESDRSTGATAADVDGDGDADLFIADLGTGNEIWLNEGGTFTKSTGGIETPRLHSVAGSFGDIDQDGDLDLFVVNHYEGPELGEALFSGNFPPGHANELWINAGDGTFLDASSRLPVELLGPAYTLAGGWVDVDGNDESELYTVNDFGPYTVSNRLVEFEATQGVAAPAELGLDVSIFGMGLAIGDLNADGVPDFAMTSWAQLVLLESSPGGWYDSGLARGFAPVGDDRQVAWGTVFADLDNDGDLDAPVSFGELLMPEEMRDELDEISLSNPLVQRDALYIQNGDGQFTEEAEVWGVADPGAERGVLAVDIDRDGWLELVKRDVKGATRVYHARCGSNTWLEVGFSSPMVGGWVQAEAGGQVWKRWIGAGTEGFASGGPPEAHFGLGELGTVDLRVHWPDGTEQLFTGLGTNRRVVVTQTAG